MFLDLPGILRFLFFFELHFNFVNAFFALPGPSRIDADRFSKDFL